MKIFSFHHKKTEFPENTNITPIHVGKALSHEDLNMQGDNSGDNISHKNKVYCELTGIYWAWRNISTTENIGFCHYRRYFLDDAILAKKDISKIDYSIFDDILKRNEIILPKQICHKYGKFQPMSVRDKYAFSHISEDWEILRDVIRDHQPNYLKKFQEFEKGNKMSAYNMFCAPRNIFEEYCDWLFPILSAAEERIEVSPYPYQSRVIGFLAERLINVFVAKNKMSVKYMPVIQI